MRVSSLLLVLSSLAVVPAQAAGSPPSKGEDPSSITVRTENFARLPSSEATYYVYETRGHTICTKLAVCDKFGNCENQYAAGLLKEAEDVEAGEPLSVTPPVAIAAPSLAKHVCLTKFGIVERR